MADFLTILTAVPKHIGVAADHGGFELKEYLVKRLCEAGCKVTEFGNSQPKPDDDYPDSVIPLACAVAGGNVDRGIAICGSGVGALLPTKCQVYVRA